MDYNKVSAEIVSAVGGKANIKNVSHCATRLRLMIIDKNKVKDEQIKKIEGVKGLIVTGSQYQIIIGDEIDDLYRTFIDANKIKDEGNTKDNKKNILVNIGTYMQSCIGFMLMPMIGTGLIKAALTILSAIGLLPDSNPTYIFLIGCCDAMMYFLPVLLAIGGAKRLGCNESMAAFIALIPLCTNYVNALNAGEQLSLFGIPVTMFTFSNQFIPAMVSVYIYSLVEKFLKKVLPSILQTILQPALSIIVMIPVIFLIIGPLMNGFNSLLALPTNFIVNHAAIFVPIMAILQPILLTFGLAGATFGLYIATVTAFGYDSIGMVGILCAHLAIGFVAVTYAFITKNKTDKELGISTGITMLFGSVSEPAIFGVLIKDRRMFFATECAGFVGGVVAALLGVKQYTFAPAYLLSLPVYVGPDSPISSVIITVIVVAIASVGFAILFSKILKQKELL